MYLHIRIRALDFFQSSLAMHQLLCISCIIVLGWTQLVKLMWRLAVNYSENGQDVKFPTVFVQPLTTDSDQSN